MKKTLSLLLVCAMLFTLCACGKKDETAKKEEKHIVTEADLQEMDFNPFAVFNNSDYVVKVTEVTADESGNCDILVEMTNKSSEDYFLAVIGGAVNGLQTGPFMTAELLAGQRREEIVSITDMGRYGIKYFTDIELEFCVYAYSDPYGDPAEDKIVHIYPYGVDNTLSYEYEPGADDSVLFDNDVATVAITGFDEDPIWGYSLNMAFINNTDNNIYIGIDSAYINGIEVDPLYEIGIYENNMAFDCVSWFQSDLQKAGITEINEIRLEFAVTDFDSGESLFEKEVTISFE